jgi:folate-dependent phosphoribosylglycinamide formyltransferase PurN
MTESRPLFDPAAAGRPLRVAAFMSGSGTNIRRLLEQNSPNYQIVFIFSDTASERCRGQEIAREYGLPYFAYDTRRFHELQGIKRTVRTPQGLAARKRYDQVAARLLKAFQIDLIALGGYMSFLTLSGGVNVHPADLSLVDRKGRRLFVGDDAVKEAIEAGRGELRSSTLWIDQGVDSGPLLMVSDPIPVELPRPLEKLKKDPRALREAADRHQERLKEAGDWVIFPLTLELLATGRLGLTPQGVATLDGKPYPRGIRPGEL